MKEGVYLMEAIFNVLPFLVFLFLLWFTYINISYAFNLRQARKEDRTLTSCLSDTGKYFYIILLIIYICILSIFIIFLILCFINGTINSIYMLLNIITFVSLITSILLQQIIYV